MVGALQRLDTLETLLLCWLSYTKWELLRTIHVSTQKLSCLLKFSPLIVLALSGSISCELNNPYWSMLKMPFSVHGHLMWNNCGLPGCCFFLTHTAGPPTFSFLNSTMTFFFSFFILPPCIWSQPLPQLLHLHSWLGRGVAIIIPAMGRLLLVYIQKTSHYFYNFFFLRKDPSGNIVVHNQEFWMIDTVKWHFGDWCIQCLYG